MTGWLSSAMRTASLCLLLSVVPPLSAQVAITTYHNDVSRTGANLGETVLNSSNVNSTSFGKVFSRAVDGQIYAQPLYLPNVQIPGQGTHNVIYVCTEHNSVYAFDADSPRLATPLWKINLGTSVLSANINVTRDLLPEVGITGSPVIDSSSGTLYVVAETYENSQAVFRLHALDVTTGAEKFNGPVVIQGSVAGVGVGSVGGMLAFNPVIHWQRPGLLLSNGNVYIGFGGHEDQEPYHGWLFAYSAATLQRVAIRCLSPDSSASGVWQGGVGLAADSSGYIYTQAGQGPFDANTGGRDFGDSVLKLAATDLSVVDSFTPSNQALLDSTDADFGSSGPVLIPGSTLGVSTGKDGKVVVWNRANLGQYHNTDHVVQEWQGTQSLAATGAGGFFAGNLFYNSTLFVWGRKDTLKAYAFNGSTFNTTPITGTIVLPDGYSNEPAMSLSSNGTVPGSPILWAAYSANGGADGNAYAGMLRAFDASNVSRELWNSNQVPNRDSSGSWAKWSPPTIVTGHVYLATFDGSLNVYGLLAPPGSGLLTGSSDASTSVNLTSEGGIDWEHWGDGSLNRKAGVTPQLTNYTVVGSGAPQSYNNDVRAIAWSDGTPTSASTNNHNGVYLTGTGRGFTITAPADTMTRTLTVHVGGWNSAGTLTAHLSDASAADFQNTTVAAPGQFSQNYTLTYKAAGAGQILTVTWKMTSGTGNIALSGAALGTTTVSGPASIVASGGTPQSTLVNTTFATPLQATVKDASNNPMSSVAVTFAAPSSGPSGTFSGSPTVLTNASGVATAPAFTANSSAGAYMVTASVSGVATTAGFNLTNTASISGSLSGSGTNSTAAVNVTTEGTTDWEHWGDSNLNHKANVTPQLSNYTVVGSGSVLAYSNDLRPVSWTDGTPLASSTNNLAGFYINGIGQGFKITAPADTTSRTLTVHVGGWNSAGTLTAHLSDASAADFQNTTVTATGQFSQNYTLTYKAAAAGQTLTVTWKMTSGTGNVTLSAAALK